MKHHEALAARLRTHVETLCGFDPPRCWGATGLEAAGHWVHDQLRAAAGSAHIQAYPVRLGSQAATAWNVVSRLGRPGSSLRVIGAHYDAVAGTPGADDNASAVAVLIELARKVAASAGPNTPAVELVAFTLEEPPSFGGATMGSSIHAGQLVLSGERVEGMISLEMLGYFDRTPGSQRFPAGVRAMLPQAPDRGDFYALSGKAYARAWVSHVDAGLRAAHLRTPLVSLVLPDSFGGADLSDHVPYQNAGIPALMLGDTAHYRNPHYHGPTDLPNTLDYDCMANLTSALASWLTGQAGAPSD